jgi:hypothetical protein
MAEHETKEGAGSLSGGPTTVEEALAVHHLATADPELDGTLTGPAHEAKYGLERAAASAAHWIAQGVHPFENRALRGDEEGAENLRGAAASAEIESAPADSGAHSDAPSTK